MGKYVGDKCGKGEDSDEARHFVIRAFCECGGVDRGVGVSGAYEYLRVRATKTTTTTTRGACRVLVVGRKTERCLVRVWSLLLSL